MPDRKKVIEGLDICLKNIESPDCPSNCPYFSDCSKYENRVVFQPLMRNALALLKEQEAVVRCKDCTQNNQCSIQFKFADAGNPGEWYCAYGKRR